MTSVQNPLFAVASDEFPKSSMDDAAIMNEAAAAAVVVGGTSQSVNADAPRTQRQRGCATVAVILTATGLIGSLVALGLCAIMWRSGGGGKET